MTENVTETSNVVQMPQRPVYHALCDDCYPALVEPPEVLTAWCGDQTKADDFPGPEDKIEFDENGIPKNACPKCVEAANCATCGLSEDAYDEGPQ